MTLKALAQEALSRLSANGVPDGTADGTRVEQAEQGDTLFQAPDAVPMDVEHAFRQKSANNQSCSTVPLPKGGTGGTALPADVVKAIRNLPRRRPKVTSSSVWRRAVTDAGRLLDEGWAGSAISLGWSLHDLFGIGPRDSDEWLSLAVWLDGQTITLMDDHQALTAEGGVYYLERWGRPNTTFVEPIFLWEFGE